MHLLILVVIPAKAVHLRRLAEARIQIFQINYPSFHLDCPIKRGNDSITQCQTAVI